MPIAGQNSGNLNTIRMDFTVRRYDTFSETFNIEYYNSDGILIEVDLTSAFAQMWVKKKKTDTTPILVMDVNLSGNEITISKDRNAMKLARGNYYHDIEVKDSDGNHITWIEGRFIVLEHITEYIDEHLNEYYAYFTNFLSYIDIPKKILRSTFESILSILDVPKRILETTFESILTILPGIKWIRYPDVKTPYVFQAIISFIDQLRQKFNIVFSNIVKVTDCDKLVYLTGWSATLVDSSTIYTTFDQSTWSLVIRSYAYSGGFGGTAEYDSSL